MNELDIMDVKPIEDMSDRELLIELVATLRQFQTVIPQAANHPILKSMMSLFSG